MSVVIAPIQPATKTQLLADRLSVVGLQPISFNYDPKLPPGTIQALAEANKLLGPLITTAGQIVLRFGQVEAVRSFLFNETYIFPSLKPYERGKVKEHYMGVCIRVRKDPVNPLKLHEQVVHALQGSGIKVRKVVDGYNLVELDRKAR